MPTSIVKKNAKRKTKENDEDSDVINTSGPATQLFKKQILEEKS